jgi:hypothetical protein
MQDRNSPGSPPPERQCRATSKRSGAQCAKWAMRGKDVCHIHGGKTPRGVASPHAKHLRFSKSVPSRLSTSYHEVMADHKKLELDNELALLVARSQEVLKSLYSGESDGLWLRLRSRVRSMDEANRKARSARRRGDEEAAERHEAAAAEHLNELLREIERGAPEGERWREWSRIVDVQRRLAESERRRHIESHQMATTEEIMAFVGALTAIIKNHVEDERTMRLIMHDIEGLVSRPGDEDVRKN